MCIFKVVFFVVKDIHFNKSKDLLFETGSTISQQDKVDKNAWKYLESGRVKPIIEKEFDLMDAIEAHKALEKGDHVGKFIMRVS